MKQQDTLEEFTQLRREFGVIPHCRPRSDVATQCQVLPCPQCYQPVHIPLFTKAPTWLVTHTDPLPVTAHAQDIPEHAHGHRIVCTPLTYRTPAGEARIWFVSRVYYE